MNAAAVPCPECLRQHLIDDAVIGVDECMDAGILKAPPAIS